MEKAATNLATVYLPDGIGFVELDDCTDFDRDVARIARVSTGSENKGDKADRRLLATLIREDPKSRRLRWG
jgi:hypothetical protein